MAILVISHNLCLALK